MAKPIWFKAKRYGWGWYPSTWQGWLILAVFILLIIGDFLRVDAHSHSNSDTLIGWVPDVIALNILLTFVCWKTGEKPRWRWGDK